MSSFLSERQLSCRGCSKRLEQEQLAAVAVAAWLSRRKFFCTSVWKVVAEM